eukprot:CAMPEP_0183710434 /NCGR_PEP_ID=MMETSP0737-20130205/6170_1 /TAXON_ID=385413 /ORGANISM="Thalassiosira miniscula, Strain CCMP1093" /LENGTH=370 /DNA_ID=CAMNT_0025938705 /DNA_START=21 /DNA_END=1133 /DNA_ORIENTATION=+
MNSIPIIDISPLVHLDERSNDSENERLKSVVSQISSACETFGFFAVTNHGVDPQIIANAWDTSKDFFDLDPSIKGSVPMTSEYPYGYENHESLGIERNNAAAATRMNPSSNLRPDSKETFSIGPLDNHKSGMPSRQWQKDAPASFAPALSQYFSVMENLARILFRGLALALQLDDASWFLHEGRFDEGHQCALRILNYPQLQYEEEEERPKKVHIRAGAHTDYGAMTILKSGGPGLQLKLTSNKTDGEISNDESSSWIDVPHLSDALIINLGDLMQRWTNDRWRSTLHRVIAVPDDDGVVSVENTSNPRIFQSARRQSMAFFVNMNGNANVVPFDSCIDEKHPCQYDSIKASDHLMQRHAQSMGETTKEL